MQGPCDATLVFTVKWLGARVMASAPVRPGVSYSEVWLGFHRSMGFSYVGAGQHMCVDMYWRVSAQD
eukprot:3436550-Alexandrium_andersonii.AAC.1